MGCVAYAGPRFRHLNGLRMFGRVTPRILHDLHLFENGFTQTRFWHFTCRFSLRVTKVIWNRTERGADLIMLDQEVDDKGTDQAQAKEIIRNLRDRAFDADDEKLAVALGRSAEQVQAVMNGSEPADDDLVMKARGIALNRGVEVE